MVLSGEAIKKGVQEGEIGISPYAEEQVEAVHANLHLGKAKDMAGGVLIIAAKSFTIAQTRERITLPPDSCGLIEGRSKLARRGISVEQSSKLIEPGSDSRMILEIFNASDAEVRLQQGQKIAKMVLLKISNEI